jgi:hypothetical protein
MLKSTQIHTNRTEMDQFDNQCEIDSSPSKETNAFDSKALKVTEEVKIYLERL